MKRFAVFLALLSVGLFLSANAFAHQPFTLAGSEKKTLKYADLTKFKNEQTQGKKEKDTLTFTETEIRLVVTTGPEDDMLSYRIQGVRNPTLAVPAGATLKILFVNTDLDMKHDLMFGDLTSPFELAPNVEKAVGSSRLEPQAEDETLTVNELTIKANENGQFTYFCSVRGHAKGGMWGNIAVGIKPDANMKMPEKTKHVHSPDEDQSEPPKKPASDMPDMAEMPNLAHKHNGMNMMRSVTDRNDAMSKEGSGTSWLPESSPEYAYMKMYDGDSGGGMLMLHGSMFVRYTEVGSGRDLSVAGKGGRTRFDAPSMFMLMYSRPLSDKAQFGLRAMVSLDPLIERGYGYPLLYQSGESFRGAQLHDRQHPHDLIDELAATFSYSFNEKNSFYLYAGVAGEPALGPPNFMHRLSGMDNPDAPISHHWQDSTHISYGVITAGYNVGKVKFEASAFNGREPNDNRWNIDKLRLNSFSGRISWNPTRDLALQISHGYLKNPEPSEPDVRILRRTTASAIYNKNLSEQKNWASSFIYGQNYANGERTNSFLFESNYSFYRNSIFGRIERVQKSGHELVLDPLDEDKIFWIGAYSLGYIYDVVQGKGIDIGLGGQLTFNQNPASLASYYGGTDHRGFQFFMRFRPSKMKGHH
jgi:rusticyanin